MAVVHYYGAKRDSYDDRDYRKRYEEHEIPSTWTHPNVDLSVYVDHVYDQKNLGSCTANALCAAYGLDLVKQSRTTTGGYYDYFDPSRLFLYYNTREREGNQLVDSGASIRDTVKSMNRIGVCKEFQWPYTVKIFNQKPPQSCYDAAVGNNLCKYERLDQDIDQFRACLKDNCPFVFGFKVYESFHNISRHEYTVQMPNAYERDCGPLGYHAVVAVGYDDSRRYFKVLNSWGSKWGDNGYFYMPYDFIKYSSLCFDFWKISFACERGKPHPDDTVPYAGIFRSLGTVPQPHHLPYMNEASGGASQYNLLDLQPPPPYFDSSGASRYDEYHPSSRSNHRTGNFYDLCDFTQSSLRNDRIVDDYGCLQQSRVNHRSRPYDVDEYGPKRYSSDFWM